MPKGVVISMVPESTSIVPVLVIEPRTSRGDEPMPAVLRMEPAFSSETCPGAEPESEISVRPPSPSRR
jgi:hypothetical protein